MAGYSGYSKSNNAMAAERDGRVPATQFAAFARRFRRYRHCTAADVAAVLVPGEWHHTSKFFNRTKYYDLRDLLELGNRRALANEIANRREWKRLSSEARWRGLTHFETEDGKPWYRIPEGWGDNRFNGANTIDLERLRALLRRKT